MWPGRSGIRAGCFGASGTPASTWNVWIGSRWRRRLEPRNPQQAPLAEVAELMKKAGVNAAPGQVAGVLLQQGIEQLERERQSPSKAQIRLDAALDAKVDRLMKAREQRRVPSRTQACGARAVTKDGWSLRARARRAMKAKVERARRHLDTLLRIAWKEGVQVAFLGTPRSPEPAPAPQSGPQRSIVPPSKWSLSTPLLPRGLPATR